MIDQLPLYPFLTHLKNLNFSLSKLRKRKKILEMEIQNYIESENRPGFKYKGKALVTQERDILENPRRKKAEKDRDGVEILHKYGIGPSISKTVLDEIITAMKGPTVNKKSLKITDL